ncbi:hypothetical protein D3C83_64680 [compost metagenome]
MLDSPLSFPFCAGSGGIRCTFTSQDLHRTREISVGDQYCAVSHEACRGFVQEYSVTSQHVRQFFVLPWFEIAKIDEALHRAI